MKINCKKNEQIILELGRTEAWAYLAKEGKLVQVERPASGTQAEVLGAVLANGFAIEKKAELILLGSDCFCQEVMLSAAQREGLSKKELKSVLAYEVEPFSGNAPDACVLGFAPAGNGAGLAVIELGVAEYGELVRVARGQAVELKAIMQAGAGAASVGVEDMEARLKGIASASLLELAKAEPVIIAKDVDSKGWGAGLAELSPEAFKRLMGWIVAAVLVLCGLHYLVVSEVVLRSKQEELARLEAPVAKVNQTKNALAKVKRELKGLKENAEGEGSASTKLAARHMAWNGFFSAVAEACGDFAFIKGIECAPDCVSLTLFSVHKDAELRFYEGLSRNGIAELGWTVDTQVKGERVANEFGVSLRYNEQNAVRAFVEEQRAGAAVDGSGEEK